MLQGFLGIQQEGCALQFASTNPGDIAANHKRNVLKSQALNCTPYFDLFSRPIVPRFIPPKHAQFHLLKRMLLGKAL